MTDSPRSIESSAVADVILAMADDEAGLSEDTKWIVYGALEGDEALTAALEGTLISDLKARQTPADAARQEPGAFVKSIKARGFRGIGPAAELALHPAPGGLFTSPVVIDVF